MARSATTTSLDQCSASERRYIRSKWRRSLGLFGPKKRQNRGLQRGFSLSGTLQEGLFTGSRVLNEVVLEGAFSEDELRRPTPYAVPFRRVCKRSTGSNAQNGQNDRPTMDGSSEQPKMTAGVDLGDKCSYLLCLIDTESGEVMDEGR